MDSYLTIEQPSNQSLDSSISDDMTDVNEAVSDITIPNENRSFCFNHAESQESSEKEEVFDQEEAPHLTTASVQ